MTIVVSFVSAGPAGAGGNGVARVRKQERIALNGTTTATSEPGDAIIIGNGESSMIAVAFGTTPDAAALDATAATSAGFPVAAGSVSPPIVPGVVGAKINVKAVT